MLLGQCGYGFQKSSTKLWQGYINNIFRVTPSAPNIRHFVRRRKERAESVKQDDDEHETERGLQDLYTLRQVTKHGETHSMAMAA